MSVSPGSASEGSDLSVFRVQFFAFPVETEIAAIESKSHCPSNPWCTNTNGRLSNPQWTPFISDGYRRWEIMLAVSRFARRFRQRRLTVFSFRFSVRLGIRVTNLEARI